MAWGAVAAAAGGVLTAGIGASQSGGDAAAPMPVDPGKQLLKYLKGLDQGLPQLAGMEGTYRPQFGQLNINDTGQFLNALLGFNSQASTAAGQQIQDARQTELGNMKANTADVLAILGGIDPNGRQQAENLGSLATQAYNRSQGPLSFQEARQADQTAREAFGARGRVSDNASVAAEVLNRDYVQQQRRAEAAALGQQSLAASQRFTDPALQILMGVPAATAMGSDLVGNAQGIIGQNQPQFINPDAGINLGLQQQQNLAAYQNAQASRAAGQSAMWGDISGSLLGLAGTIYQKR